MGMIANYQQITDRELEELKSNEDLFEDTEELQENENLNLCDLDKMWDALHFLLTGKSTDNPLENDPISESIVGQFNISGEEIEEFISGTRADRVKEIAAALQKIDFETYLEKFNMSDFAKNDIYPDIWKNKEDADELKDELRDSFENLRTFYMRMAEKDCAVLVSIY